MRKQISTRAGARIITDDGTLIGIVSRSDVLRVCSWPDAEIQHQAVKELIVGTFLCDPDRFTVTIKGTPETTMGGRR